jgi:integrase/recombinase XerD
MQIPEFLNTIGGLSENTRKAYEQTLYQYDAEYNGEEPTPNGMQKFLNRYSPSSLQRHKAALKAYWEWFCPDKTWPFTRRSFLAPREQKLRYLKAEVVMKMIDNAKNEDDRMFLFTLFMTGCRIHEVKLIDQESLTDAGVVVKTKGGKTRLKYLTKDVMVKLRKYAKGKRSFIFPLSYGYYNKLLKTAGKAVGHPEITLHMIRHSRAVDLRKKGATLEFVQQFLGHASITTTAIYLQVGSDEINDELEKLDNGGK